MATWKVGGFRIVQHQGDHDPLHVHVFKNGDFIGRYAVIERRWIEGPYHAGHQAERAIRRWLESEGY